TFDYQAVNSGEWANTTWSLPADQWEIDYNTMIGGTIPQVNGQTVRVSLNTAHTSYDDSTYAQLNDVNGDGLMDIVQSRRCLSNGTCMATGHGWAGLDKTYIYINTGAGWVYD